MVTMATHKQKFLILEQKLIPSVFLVIGSDLARRGLYLGIETYTGKPQLRYGRTPAKHGCFGRIFDHSIYMQVRDQNVLSVETETDVLLQIPLRELDLDRVDEIAGQIIKVLPGIGQNGFSRRVEQDRKHTQRQER